MSQNDTRMIAVIAIGIAVILSGGAWWMSRPGARPANSTPKAVTSTEAPIDTPAPPVNLPPLDQMDAFPRPVLAALSSRPEKAQWLATDDLVRQIAMALDRAGAGDTPSRDFKVLAPASPF